MATSTASRNVITLKGSTDIVTEFFGYSINSILYQRGIYAPETFSRTKKYGLAMLVTKDESLKQYLADVLGQLHTWLMNGKVRKLVLVILGLESKKTRERWQFDIQQDNNVKAGGGGEEKVKAKKVIMGEIQALIRQITASVTFLPILDEPCTFDLLFYASEDATDEDVPMSFEETDEKLIKNQVEVPMRSFSTKVHKVDALVAYDNDCDEDEEDI